MIEIYLLKHMYFNIYLQNGQVYEGECWPGRSNYIDFRNPNVLLLLYYFRQENFGMKCFIIQIMM